MARLRKPLQGAGNIIRFNWHFYALLILVVVALLVAEYFLPAHLSVFLYVAIALGTFSMLTSLWVSWYVYDYSQLYTLSWLDSIIEHKPQNIVNINAGFDEFSALLQAKYPDAQLTVLDFYNPTLHTEVSIKRARKAYPPYAGTVAIQTGNMPLAPISTDAVFLLLAAHEIRNDAERIQFFSQLCNALKPDGRIIVTEHIRDAANLLAYNIGAFHFHTRRTWLATFAAAGLQIEKEQKITPFISTFVLRKHGASS